MLNDWVDHTISDPARREVTFVEHLGSDGVTESWTYGDVAEASERLRDLLHEQTRNYPPGARIGLVARNSVHWVVGDIALLRSEFVEVPVPRAVTAEQATNMLANCAACLVDSDGLSRLRDWDIPDSVDVVLIEEVLDNPTTSVRSQQAITLSGGHVHNLAKVIHSSGTTGFPKGVQIRNAGLHEAVRALDSIVPQQYFHHFLSTTTLSQLTEQILAVYLPLLRGGRVAFLPGEIGELGSPGTDLNAVLSAVLDTDFDAVFLPPALIDLLAKRPTDGTDHVATHLTGRLLLTGGAPAIPNTLASLHDRGIDVYEGYGLSENSTAVAWNAPGRTKLGTVGRSLDHCEVRTDRTGQLLVRSTSLLAGYESHDPTTLTVDDDGWLHTGDQAHIDADGFITISARRRAVIRTALGRNVSPEYVESTLRGISGVTEVVVFGRNLPRVVAMTLTVEPTPYVAELEHFAAEHLCFTDQPERYLLVADSEQVRERYFTASGRPRRDLLWTELVEPWLSTTAIPPTRSP